MYLFIYLFVCLFYVLMVVYHKSSTNYFQLQSSFQLIKNIYFSIYIFQINAFWRIMWHEVTAAENSITEEKNKQKQTNKKT